MQAGRFHEMEADLVRLRGVHSAKIHVEDGVVTEVHVVADDRRRPKGIVRDVVTTLYVRHGIRIDHQKVSVAASCADPSEARLPGVIRQAKGTLEIASVQLLHEEQILRATVEIRAGSRTLVSTQEAVATRANQLRVVAAATLEAVAQSIEGWPSLHLEEARRITLGNVPVVLVHVILVRPDGEESLIGCCAAMDNRLDAAAGAVLDAVSALLPAAESEQAEEIEYMVQEEASE